MSSSQDKPGLKLDWCSYKAAKYAVEHWHYSQRMPKFKQVYVGAWEGGAFIGAVVFGLSVTPYLGDAFGLSNVECAELTRIALTRHASPVSKVAARAIRMVHEQSPGLRLLVSYADPVQGHVGAIYQAMNWTYVGCSARVRQYYWRGQWRKDSSMFRAFKANPELRRTMPYRDLPAKHKYLYPLDKAMAAQIEPLRQPYPKRADVVQPVAQQGPPADGGANPTRPLEGD